jgi:hypothetical protein
MHVVTCHAICSSQTLMFKYDTNIDILWGNIRNRVSPVYINKSYEEFEIHILK